MLSFHAEHRRRHFACLILALATLGAYWSVSLARPTVVVAQDTTTSEGEKKDAPKKPSEQTALEFFFGALGWLYTILFLIISFVFVALVVIGALIIRRSQFIPPGLPETLETQLNEKRFQEAYELAKADDSMLGQVFSAGMGKIQQGYEPAEKAMQEAADDRLMDMEHKMSYIALIGVVAPMVGLLGTVDGMVAAFRVIANSETTPKPNELAQGISTALITTLVGLWLAIPAVTFFAFYRNRISKLSFETGVVVDNLMARFKK